MIEPKQQAKLLDDVMYVCGGTVMVRDRMENNIDVLNTVAIDPDSPSMYAKARNRLLRSGPTVTFSIVRNDPFEVTFVRPNDDLRTIMAIDAERRTIDVPIDQAFEAIVVHGVQPRSSCGA